MTTSSGLKSLLVLGMSLLAAPDLAQALEGEQTVFPAMATEQTRLVVNGATDVDAMKPLILDFQQLAPEVTVEFNDYVTNDLFREAESACKQGIAYGDILLSSSVDQLVKLANDGCAQDHRSRETESVADWANWRDEVFGFTFEPAVIVYDGRRVPPEDVPRSHVEIAELLRAKPSVYRNRIGTYDVRVSGIGYLLAFHDALQAPTTYGRLLESLSRADVVTRCCNNEVLGQIASGRLLIAYNVLGSYAYAASRRNPDLRVVIPRDYALILSRGALIPKLAPSPEPAKRFLDYLLSPRGQKVAREKAFFFSEGAPLPPGVDGPMSLVESGVGRPIRIGPALLAAQDKATRDRFIANWSSLFSPARP
jgi:iron(III) transport system substrate-binding protein